MIENFELADYIQTPEVDTDETLLDLVIPLQAVPTRFDKVLAQLLPEYSRSRLQQWIDNAQVTLDGHAASARAQVYGGERVQVTVLPLPQDTAFQPEPVALEVVHEDDDILVINKPAGLVVHPAAGNWSGTLLNGLLYREAALAQVPRAGIVHRLDKDTSGLMVVARTVQAQLDLVRQLQARTVKREYLALVWGTLNTAGTVDAPLARDPRNPLRIAVAKPNTGKAAMTHYLPLVGGTLRHDNKDLPVTLVQCKLATGRTHQIRVHLQHLGFALVGDPLYGTKNGKKNLAEIFHRQALHAWQLGLIHPATQQPCQWRQALPDDMQALLHQAGIEVGQRP